CPVPQCDGSQAALLLNRKLFFSKLPLSWNNCDSPPRIRVAFHIGRLRFFCAICSAAHRRERFSLTRFGVPKKHSVDCVFKDHQPSQNCSVILVPTLIPDLMKLLGS
ncbi:unnamed protein product, partial [Gulo gulo]